MASGAFPIYQIDSCVRYGWFDTLDSQSFAGFGEEIIEGSLRKPMAGNLQQAKSRRQASLRNLGRCIMKIICSENQNYARRCGMIEGRKRELLVNFPTPQALHIVLISTPRSHRYGRFIPVVFPGTFTSGLWNAAVLNVIPQL